MARPTATARLAVYERRYRQAARAIAQVGFIRAGSVIRRATTCGTPGCRCHADPPRLHGPYYQWTAKVGGKTVTRRLSEGEARLYKGWIANDRELRARIGQMRRVAAQATKLILDADVSE